MTANVIHLRFDGYWNSDRIHHAPSTAGIFLIYSGIYNDDIGINNMRLIDIKSSLCIQRDIEDYTGEHWEKHLNKGETLFYSAAQINKEESVLDIIEILLKNACFAQDKKIPEMLSKFGNYTIGASGACLQLKTTIK